MSSEDVDAFVWWEWDAWLHAVRASSAVILHTAIFPAANEVLSATKASRRGASYGVQIFYSWSDSVHSRALNNAMWQQRRDGFVRLRGDATPSPNSRH